MRILLLGSSGQVGSQLLLTLAPLGEVIAPSRSDGWDLSDPSDLTKSFSLFFDSDGVRMVVV